MSGKFIKEGESQPILNEQELNKLIERSDDGEDKDADTQVVTICKNCIFAAYDEDDTTRVQTGCFMGRLDQFNAIDTEIKQAEEVDIEPDTGKELDSTTTFNIIGGRICTTQREQKWIDTQSTLQDRPLDEGFGLEELMQLATDEVKVGRNTTLIVFIPGGTEWDAVKAHIEHLKKHPFTHVIFMNCSRELMPINFLHNIQHEYKEGLPFTWQMEFILQGTHHTQIKELMHQCIDIAVKKASTVYYMFTYVDNLIETEYVQSIDDALNKNLERILMVHENEEQGLFSQVRLHKLVGGFTNDSYIEKLKRIAEAQECPNLIRTVHSLQS